MSATAIDQPKLNHVNTKPPGGIHDEKERNSSDHEAGHLDTEQEKYGDFDVTKPFPVDPDEPEDTHQLTFRALFVGCLLGAVVGASNIYLGLKTGFTFGPQLFGAIFGYAILKPLSKALPATGIIGKMFGGTFGPKVEKTALYISCDRVWRPRYPFVSAIPAMYRLELLSSLPKDDVGKLIAITACAGFFGVFFVIPLRSYYIIKQKLTFPTPAATAYTIRSLHSGKTGAEVAKKKSLALLYSFGATFVFKVMTGYAPGILYDWHIGWTLFRLGFTSIISLDNYGWWIEFTPAFFGAGMLSGMNASLSFFGGSVLAWGIIAPSLIATGKAFGTPASDEFPEIISYGALSFSDPEQYITRPSPRYWLLWPGVLMMLVFSFVDILMSMKPMVKNMRKAGLNTDYRSWFHRSTDEEIENDDDPATREERIPTWWWTIGLGLSVVMCCAILATIWDFNVGDAILSLILGFIFSFIGVQSAGQTDVNPVSTVAKASQLIFGGIGKSTNMEQNAAYRFNLTAGVIAAGSAAQATDMTGDLKTGYLLRAKPKNQFLAQVVGAIVAIFLNVGLFILFTTASPCIITGAKGCTYGAPSVSAWAAVAVGVSSPRLPIPPSSGYTAIGLSVLAAVSVTVKHLWIPTRFHGYVPNWNAVGLAFVVPQVFYSIAMAVGAILNAFWLKRNPAGYDLYMFAVSAGLLAGEGLGGVFQALLAVAGVDGGKYGTSIGCPAFEFCG